MNAEVGARRARPTPRRRWSAALVAAFALSSAACSGQDDNATSDTEAGVDSRIEFRNEAGPHVDVPDSAMAMTVDALVAAGDDILIRLRVENSDDGYLDMGVQDTIYGPLLIMRDDRDTRYESYAVEPAGIPGRRIADLSFRLAGPLDSDAVSFTLELATQRGPLTSPIAPLPNDDGIRWRIDDATAATPSSNATILRGSEPIYAAVPHLPDLVHFWLETDPLSSDR